MLISLRHLADARLVRRVLAGHRDEYAVLVERYALPVEAAIRSSVFVPGDIEDAAQETFIKAYERLDTLRVPARFAPWLMTIARTTAISFMRKRKHEMPLEGSGALDTLTTAPAIETRERERVVAEAMAKLDDAQREALQLFYFAGKSLAEIADLQEIGKDAAAKRLQRARAALGESLLRGFGEEARAQAKPDATRRAVMAAVATLPLAWSGKAYAAESAGMAAGAAAKTGVTALVAAAAKVAGLAVAALAAFSLAALGAVSAGAWSDLELSFAKRPVPETLAAAAHPAKTVAASTPSAPPVPVAPAEGMSTGPGSVQGVLLTMDKKPVPNAAVKLEAVTWKCDEMPPAHPFTLETTSGPDGAFLFEALPLEHYVVIALAPKSAGALSYMVRKEKSHQDKPVTMYPRAALSGRLLDETGAPMPNTVLYPITHSFAPEEEFTHAETAGARAQTDADGRFSFPALWPGAWKFYVYSEKHVPIVTDFVETPGDDVTIRLPQPAILSGMLERSPQGTAVPDTTFVLRFGKRIVLDAATDGEGRFAIAALCPGEYAVEVNDPVLLVDSAAPKITLAPGQNIEDAVIPVIEGATIMGRVFDKETGEGVAGVEVSADWERKATTDASGGFTLTGLGKESYTLTADTKDTGYVSAGNPGAGRGAYAVACTLGHTTEDVEVGLTKGVGIEGCLPGIGEGGITVEVTRADNWFMRSKELDESGCFSLNGLPPGARATVIIHTEPFALCNQSVQLPSANDGLLDIPVPARMDGVISGKVMIPDTMKSWKWIASADLENDYAEGWKLTAGTDKFSPANEFTFTHLPPGRYRISAYPNNTGIPDNSLIKEVDLGPGATIAGLILGDELPNAPQTTRTLAGQVMDRRNAPILFATVAVPGGTGVFTTTDDKGRFSLTGVPEGDVTVGVFSSKHSPWLDTVPPETANLVIRLEECATLSGRVLDARTQTPITSFSLTFSAKNPLLYQFESLRGLPSLEAQNRYQRKEVSSPEGQFHCDNLPAGDCSIQAEAKGYAGADPVLMTLAPGEASQVDLMLDSGFSVTGIVLTPENMPLQGVAIFTSENTDRGPSASTGVEGDFIVTSLRADVPYTLFFRHPDYSLTRVPLSPGAADTPLTVRMDLPASIEVHAVANGAPVSDYLLEAVGQGRASAPRTDARDPSIQYLEGLDTGAYHVIGFLGASETGTRIMRGEDVTLASGEHRTITFDFTTGTLTCAVVSSYLEDTGERFSVTLRSHALNEDIATTDALVNGDPVVFPRLIEGGYTVSFSPYEGALVQTENGVAAAQAGRYDITINAGGDADVRHDLGRLASE